MENKLNDNHGRPRQEYFNRIAAMADPVLFDETEHKMYLSAYASNPRSDYHWHVRAIYDEWSKRGKIDQYEKAFNYVSENP